MSIVNRGSTFHLPKRVPHRYKHVDQRETVWISLHTGSENVALQKAPVAWQHHIETWEARRAGDSADAERRFDAARELAQVRGYRYLSADRVAELSQEELLQHIEATTNRTDEPNKVEATALLGGAAQPELTVTRALGLGQR